jgi:spermidine synthase
LLEDLQRVDASSDPTAVVVQMNQARLPLLLHPEPRRVLFLGLGTGISAAGSLPFPALERSAVELSQGAINAARGEFRPVNGGITDHLRLVRDDARHFLLSDTGAYDVIIGDLFHPDLVGRSSLLSRQQFLRTRDHLAPRGLFVQWLALNQFDLESLLTVLRTFRAAFPEGVLFVDGFRLALVGGRDAGVSSAALLDNLLRLDTQAQEQATGGEGPWTWLSRYWGAIPDTPGALQDEWAPVIEYRLPSARYNGDLDLAAILDWLRTLRPRPAQAAAELAIEPYDRQLFEDAYAATDLSYQRWLALLRGQPGADQQYLPLAYQANPRDRWVGFALADGVLAQRAAASRRGLDEQALFESVLKIRPDHPEALRGLWHLARERGDAQAAADYRERLRALSPLDAELKAVQ